MTLESVAGQGDHLETLRALRDYLARAMDDCDSARDQAALSARLMDALARINELTADTEEEELDDFASLLVLPGGIG